MRGWCWGSGRGCVKIIRRRQCQFKSAPPGEAKHAGRPSIKSCAKLPFLSFPAESPSPDSAQYKHLCVFAVAAGLPSIKNVNWNFFFFSKKRKGEGGGEHAAAAAVPPPPVTGCQNAIFQIRLYLDNLLNCNRFPAGRHITIGTSLLNKSDTEPSLCGRRQINVRHRANNISSASRVGGLSLGCYIGFISLSAGRGPSDGSV